jgi:hypothetical protein
MTWLPTCVQVVVAAAPVICAKNSIAAKSAVLFITIFSRIDTIYIASLGSDCGITLEVNGPH